MGRDYGIVAPSYWTGETGKKLRSYATDVQLLGVYLITCHSANMIGLYYLPLPTAAHELGWKIERLEKALGRASEGSFAHYDSPSEVVFVPEMAAWQVGEPLRENDNRVRGIIKLWQEHSKCRFYIDFHQRYCTSYHLPEPSPLQGPYKPLRSQEQEQEQEQDGRKRPACFVPPELEEVSEYVATRETKIDPEAFIKALTYLTHQNAESDRNC